jgi:subtilase family serine protease
MALASKGMERQHLTFFSVFSVWNRNFSRFQGFSSKKGSRDKTMAHLRSLPLYLAAVALFCCTALTAQQFAPAVRIVNRIDESQLVTLKGNTHPQANTKNDRGRVDSNLPMTDLILVLSRSAEQQAAFDKFVASQYQPGSPDFHHWLTPEQVGENFGPSQTDIATVTNWLTGHGFSVDEVTKDRMTIRFSGTAGQVESAFHTEIHNLSVNGEQHIGNMTDPKIPAALSPAVVGVKALHNFFPKPLHKLGGLVTRSSETGKLTRVGSDATSEAKTGGVAKAATVHPEFGINVPSSGNNSAYLVEDVAPYDFATIYNVLPLWNASSPIDGTGQTIAIAGTSRVNPVDVANFRSTFGLPAGTAPQQIVANGTDPGICTSTATNAVCGIGDLIENSLDVEWSGAVAKGAKIVLVVSGSNSATTDTVFSSANYVIQNNTAKILNVSYGNCELGMSSADNAAYNTLWQTAYSEGIAVFVAAGDQGSAGCDSSNSSSLSLDAAQYGLAVSGLASTPYNTAVGGTDFNWCSLTSTSECTASPYWNSSNNSTTGASALGYVPEVPWNDTCASTLGAGYLEWVATQVGVSGVKDAETACNFVVDYYSAIYRQDGVDLSGFVNVVGGGGGASNCSTNTSVDTSTGVNLGTCTGGYAKPSWQTGVSGIPADGKRDIPDVSFFAADGYLSGSAYLICVSEAGSACVSSTTITAEPIYQEVGGTSASSPAMAGVMALINQKAGAAQGSPNTQLYSLASKQTYSNCKAENGTTGNGCLFNDIDTGNNAMPCIAGTSNCTVLYSGDAAGILSGYNAGSGFDLATGLGSLNVANVVNAWVSDAGTGTSTVTVTPPTATIAINNSLTLTVAVAGSGTLGTPTGSVILSGGGYTLSQTIGASPCASAASCVFTIPANSLTAGSYPLTATYSGDGNYASATATATVTVNVMMPTVTLSAPASGNVANQLSVPVTVTGPAGSTAIPTGTVAIASGSYSSPAQQLNSGGATLVIPANTLSAGNDKVTVTYSGDANYASNIGTATVSMTQTTALPPTVTVSAASTVETGQPLTVTAGVSGSGVTPTGTLILTSGSYSSGAQTIGVSPCTSAASCVFTVPANKLSVGTDTLAVAYSGDSVYAAGSKTTTVTVTQSVYALAASTPTTAIAPGATATSTVTVTSATNYTGTITFTSCTATTTPANAAYVPTCTPSGTVTMANGTASGTATLNISTTAASAMLAWPKLGGKRGWAGAGGGAVLAFLVLLGVPRRKRNWLSMLGVLVMMVALGTLAGCGGGGSSSSGGSSIAGTTAGAYTFTVTGTGNDVNNTVETATFTLTVN